MQPKIIAEKLVFLNQTELTTEEVECLEDSKYSHLLEFVAPPTQGFNKAVDQVLGKSRQYHASAPTTLTPVKKLYADLLNEIENKFGIDADRLTHKSIQALSTKMPEILEFSKQFVANQTIDNNQKRIIIQNLFKHKIAHEFLHELLVQITHFM